MADFAILNLAKELKVKPEQAIHCLKIPLGKKVAKGDLLAFKKSAFRKKQAVFSPIAGVLHKVEESTGRLMIKKKELIKKSSLAAKAGEKNRVSGVFGFGKAQGQLLFINKTLRLKDIKADLKNEVVGVYKLASIGVIFKASALDIAALVVESVDKDWLEQLDEVKEKISLALLAGALGLKNMNKKKVICDGQNKQLIIV